MFDALKTLLVQPIPDGEAERWTTARRGPRECDLALNGTSRQWLRRLPPRRRPLRLCERYPHVANRIAWCWHDRALSEQVLEDLLVDRRGGRQGFSPVVVRELQRLRDFNRQARAEEPAQSWWSTLERAIGG